VPDTFKDGPSERADVARRAHDSLVSSVEEMRRRLRLDKPAPAILDEIKKTMHVVVPPYGFTVLQNLCEKERQTVFNQMAASEFALSRQEFDRAIEDYVVAREGTMPARRIRKLARNTWKQDAGADRRTRGMEQLPPEKFRSPYRGRSELYDPEVVAAFENAIAHAIGRPCVSWTRGTRDNKSSGPILNVLIAAVQWAMRIAWQCAAPWGTPPPKVPKAEGLLGIVKAKRRRKRSTN
jgi:hypothetical protein